MLLDYDDLLCGLTERQQDLCLCEMRRLEKDRVVALLLTLFLGGIGAHHYYLRQIGLGILYTLFCWTFIPAVMALIELFMITERVETYNRHLALDLISQIKSLG